MMEMVDNLGVWGLTEKRSVCMDSIASKQGPSGLRNMLADVRKQLVCGFLRA